MKLKLQIFSIVIKITGMVSYWEFDLEWLGYLCRDCVCGLFFFASLFFLPVSMHFSYCFGVERDVTKNQIVRRTTFLLCLSRTQIQNGVKTAFVFLCQGELKSGSWVGVLLLRSTTKRGRIWAFFHRTVAKVLLDSCLVCATLSISTKTLTKWRS
jgi:hypothetical protein